MANFLTHWGFCLAAMRRRRLATAWRNSVIHGLLKGLDVDYRYTCVCRQYKPQAIYRERKREKCKYIGTSEAIDVFFLLLYSIYFSPIFFVLESHKLQFGAQRYSYRGGNTVIIYKNGFKKKKKCCCLLLLLTKWIKHGFWFLCKAQKETKENKYMYNNKDARWGGRERERENTIQNTPYSNDHSIIYFFEPEDIKIYYYYYYY